MAATNEVMNDLVRSKSPVSRNLESHVLADIGVSGVRKIVGRWAARAWDSCVETA